MMNVMKYGLVMVLCVSAAGWANLIDQNFEDTSVFMIGQAWNKAGVGDGTTSQGHWWNDVKDYTVPQTVAGNSSFTAGNQCVEIYRLSNYGEGVAYGMRTNDVADGSFEAEIHIMPETEAAQFAFQLLSSNESLNGVGIGYWGGTLYTRYNNLDWKAKTSGVVPGQWFKVKFVGDVATGFYDAYTDWGDGAGWRQIAVDQPFSAIDVAGFAFFPYKVDGSSIFFDEARIVPEPATMSLLLLGMSGLLRRRR